MKTSYELAVDIIDEWDPSTTSQTEEVCGPHGKLY